MEKLFLVFINSPPNDIFPLSSFSCFFSFFLFFLKKKTAKKQNEKQTIKKIAFSIVPPSIAVQLNHNGAQKGVNDSNFSCDGVRGWMGKD